ncbi:MAG: hypothetical protein V9E81_16290 [Marmoricola sp.]
MTAHPSEHVLVLGGYVLTRPAETSSWAEVLAAAADHHDQRLHQG